MGSGSSKTVEVKEIVKYVESDESKRAAILAKLNHQLEDLKKEVTLVPQIINDNVKTTVSKMEDATLLRYSQLQDMSKIEENIKQVFKGFPILDVIVDAASNMVAAMNATEELTEILRWQQRVLVKRVGDKVYGLEVHYKVKILEETKGWVGSKRRETVVLVAYKAIAHAMDLNPADYPDDEELPQVLKF